MVAAAFLAVSGQRYKQCLILSLILNLSVYAHMSAVQGAYDKQGKQHLSSSEMKRGNNVPLSSQQTKTQTKKRPAPPPQHKQQANPLNKCNFKPFLRSGKKSVSNVQPVCVCSA